MGENKTDMLNLWLADGSEIFKGTSSPTPPGEILLLRYGTNEFTKAGQRDSFEFSEDDADNVIAEFKSRGRDIVIDYEHQTLSGQEAPAAGWIDAVVKTAAGLVAKVKYWTDRAAEMLKHGEYRYFSPVLQFKKASPAASEASGTGSSRLSLVVALHSVALTNHPSLHNVQQLAANDTQVTQDEDITTNKKGKAMDNELIAMLGFSDADQGKAKERIQDLLKAETELEKKNAEVAEFLKLHDVPSLDHVTGKIQSMVPASEKLALEAKIRTRDAEEVVKQAFDDGKLAEKSRDWAQKFAEKDLDAFKDWAAGAPVIVPLGHVERKDLNDVQSVTTEKFDDHDKKIMKNIGLTDEQIAAKERQGK